MKYKIDKPCSENWEGMKKVENSRFCSHCKKNVQDFTTMDKREIHVVLQNLNGKKICGRVFPSQLDFNSKGYLPTVYAYSRANNPTNFSINSILLSAIIVSSCSNPEGINVNNKINPSPINSAIESRPIKKIEMIDSNVNTTASIDSIPIKSIPKTNSKDSLKQKIWKKRIEPPTPEIEIMGEIIVEPQIDTERPIPYSEADVQPEFPGGMDSLVSFLKKNIKYPKSEIKNKIEGRVFIGFVLTKNGEVDDIKVLRYLSHERVFANEAIRVVKLIPKWKPAEHNGEKIDVSFTLPIEFKL